MDTELMYGRNQKQQLDTSAPQEEIGRHGVVSHD